MDMSGCASVLDADAPVASLAQEVFDCGYVHIGPGLFPATFVQSIAKHVRRWDGNSTDVFHSGVDGGRINLVPPRRGPFADDKPFRKPERKLFELLQQAVRYNAKSLTERPRTREQTCLALARVVGGGNANGTRPQECL